MDLVERAFGLFEDFGQTLFTFRIPDRPLGCAKCCFHQRAEWTKKGKRFRSRPLAPVAPAFSALPDAFDCFLFTLQFLDSLGRQAVDFPAVLMVRLYQSFVLKLLQGGVNRACTCTVESAGSIGQFFDQLITMLWAFLEQRKNRKADFTESKETSAWSSGKTGKRSPILPWAPTARATRLPVSAHMVLVRHPGTGTLGGVMPAWITTPTRPIGERSPKPGVPWPEKTPKRFHR